MQCKKYNRIHQQCIQDKSYIMDVYIHGIWSVKMQTKISIMYSLCVM